MVFMQVSNSKGTIQQPFDRNALEVLAKFPLVCFEKWQGSEQPGYYEEKVAAACEQVKAISPRTSCLMYLNTECAYNTYGTVSDHGGFYDHPEYWLKLSNGKPATNGCPKSACKNKDCGNHGILIPDYSVPGAGTLYLNACANLTRNTAVDGCNMDRCNNLEGKSVPLKGVVPKNGAAAYDAGKLKALEAIARDAYLFINNINTWDGVTGAYANNIEGFGPQEKHIYTLQALAREGLGTKAHCCRNERGTGDKCTWSNIEHGLAAFLIGAGEKAFFSCGESWEFGSWVQWFDQYDYPLGKPVADGVKGKDGVWTRAFQSGTKVRFDPMTKKGSITWGSKPVPPSPSPSPPSPTPSPPSPPPSPPSPPSPSQCGSCKVCLNPTNRKCQTDGAHRPKTKAACEAKSHIWCGPSRETIV
jgi:hypothetical protein